MSDEQFELPGASDRRRVDRRADFVPLAEYTIPELRKAVITAAVLVGVLALFLYMVGPVLVAAVAGVVAGAYLVPLQRRIERRRGSRKASAVLTILCVTLPLVAALAYSWIEISGAAGYLNENRQEVAARLTTGLQRVPFMQGVEVRDDLSRLVDQAAREFGEVVEDLQAAISIITVSIAVAFFTIYYILTDRETILAYIQRKIPGRYRELTDEMSRNIQKVVYGALFATFVTQLAKSVIVLVLNLLFDVPLAVVLAFLSFFIGLFPIVGSWAIYVPVGIYLMLWRGSLWQGATIILVGFLVNTLFLSTYLRPKIAAERSDVLNFYWMLIALITGVYTFGLVGIIIGPVLIAVLKAVFDTVTGDTAPPLLGPREAARAAPRT